MTDTKEIKLLWKKYIDLSNDELYAILHLRQKVFVLEQNCPYIDADYSDHDQNNQRLYKDNFALIQILFDANAILHTTHRWINLYTFSIKV